MNFIQENPDIKLLFLEGELGAGKTCLVKGIAKGLSINEAITNATGLKEPEFKITIKSFNEYNSEPSKEGYTDPRS